jgi:predicted Zn finger-like uncharacterized protein
MRLQCPECDASVHVSTVIDGKRVKCPKCETKFHPPVEDEDEDDEDDAPRRKKRKKAKSKFPVVPVAIVSVGVLALAVAAIVLMSGGKKPDDTAGNTPNANAGNPAVVAPPVNPKGPGERPKDEPPEVQQVFAIPDDPNLFAPVAPVVATLIGPANGARKLTLSLHAPPPAKATEGKLTRDEVEKAAAYIKVQAGIQGATGSGFLVKVNGDEGLVATNFHVVAMAAYSDQGRVSVVFDSGLKSEVEYPAEIVASEPVADLAILKVRRARNLPKPLEPRFYQPPQALQDVLVYGFPLGANLGIAGRNPAITISRANISSLRRGDDGELQQLQLDGNVNSGNSGGPIVDQDGRLIGITVAKIRQELGSGIGFAIPAEQLRIAMEGRFVYPAFLPPLIRENDIVFQASVPLSDPSRQFKSANLLVWSGSGASPDAEKGPDGKWKPINGATSILVSDPVNGLARADVPLPNRIGDTNVAVQTVITLNSGATLVSPPVNFLLKVSARIGPDNDLPISTFVNEMMLNPGRFEGFVVGLKGNLTGQPTAVWDKFALALTDETGKAMPPGWTFLVDSAFAKHLKDVTIPVGKGVPVRLAVRVGPNRADLGPILRVVRADVMEGVKIAHTVPPLASSSFVDQNAMASLNQNPKSFIGRNVTVEGRMSMNIRGTPENPQYTFFLANGTPAGNLYFTSAMEFANRVRAVDLPEGSIDRVRATVRVDPREKVNELPVARITKLEFVGRSGEKLLTLE